MSAAAAGRAVGKLVGSKGARLGRSALPRVTRQVSNGPARMAPAMGVHRLAQPVTAARQPPLMQQSASHSSDTNADLRAIVATFERAHPDKPKDQNGVPQGEDASFHIAGTYHGHGWTVCGQPRHDIHKRLACDDCCSQLTLSLCVRVCSTGIADGVGGWASEGIDAGAYARELMKLAEAEASEPSQRENPIGLLHSAHQRMDGALQGSCTAVIAVLERNMLRVANLGDSGVIGYRRAKQGEMFIRTKEQQHRFNCPLQLGPRGFGDSAENAGQDAQAHGTWRHAQASEGFQVPHKESCSLLRACVSVLTCLRLVRGGNPSE